MLYLCTRNRETNIACKKQVAQGPFVYRLGRQVFILERGVRLPYGLQEKRNLIALKIKVAMANHKSSIKRIRQADKKKLHNRYYAKTARNAVRKFRATTDKTVATEMLPKISAMLDKLAKRNIIHKNKASNLKSKLAVFVNKLA